MYLINYECYECNHKFQDAWSSIVDSKCPECGVKDCTATAVYDLDELPGLIVAAQDLINTVQPGADPVEEYFREPLERCRKAIAAIK